MDEEQRGAKLNPHFIPADYFRELRREELFPDATAPLELDVGCGEGAFLLALAGRYPERRFLGLERLLGRVRKVCRRIERLQLKNVRVLRLESAYALECLLPRETFTRIHVLFPDPWPKKRHHRRRFLQPTNVPHLARVLAPGGELFFKTDHADYFHEGVEAIRKGNLFEQLDWPQHEAGFFYPPTDFETVWESEGRTTYRARFRKNV